MPTNEEAIELTDEQREVLNDQLKAADDAAEKLVEEFKDDPNLEFVANPGVIGDGMNIPADMRKQWDAYQKFLKFGLPGREHSTTKKYVNKAKRTRKRKLQKQARKASRK